MQAEKQADVTKERAPRSLPTLQENANLVRYIVEMCCPRDGTIPDRGLVFMLTRNEIEDLKVLQSRLERIAPWEIEIRRLVTNKEVP